eukprot:3572271-Amphidinium_carterae.1
MVHVQFGQGRGKLLGLPQIVNQTFLATLHSGFQEKVAQAAMQKGVLGRFALNQVDSTSSDLQGEEDAVLDCHIDVRSLTVSYGGLHFDA